jgi:dUTPase
MERIRFVKVRKVHEPTRNNVGDAGLDFYIPEDFKLSDIALSNPHLEISEVANTENTVSLAYNEGNVTDIFLGPNTRINLPSGIRILAEPINSALIVANKSGRSSKQGLIFTAQVGDSPYTGEYNLCVYNTSCRPVQLKAGEALVQLIHTPIYLTEPEEITQEEFDKEAKNWGTRGDKGMGSGNNKPKK